MSRKKIFAISGSTRKNSTNELILQAIAERFDKELDVHIYKDIDTLPHFNPDVNEEAFSQEVKNFLAQIQSADGVLICTPEYVFSLPGTLKNALEWTVATTVFSHKPFAFIVASGSGEKAYESLDLVMSTLLQYPVPAELKLLIKGGRAKIKSIHEIDPPVMEEIVNLTEALKNEIEKSRQEK